MKKLLIALGMVMAAAVAMAGESFAYQGVLRSGTGGAITATDQVIEFRLYSEAESETSAALWGRKVAVRLDTNGLFNVELSDTAGSAIASLTNTLEYAYAQTAKLGKDLYIGLWVVGSTGEIRPRQRMLTTPMSSFARDVNAAKGDFTVEGTATFNGSVRLGSSSVISGAANFEGAATFSQAASFKNGVEISGGVYGAMPIGTVVMWWGDSNKVPNGWELCDGTNGKPNLVGRFPVGAGTGSYSKGDQGGADQVTLTTGQMPKHTHKIPRVGGGLSVDSSGDGYHNHFMEAKYKDGWDVTDPSVESAGNDEAHENRPPYTALYFIIRVK